MTKKKKSKTEFFESFRALASFRRRLMTWYDKHARPLPWRGGNDPYKIWVSEIMLQQTTTQTVRGYFDRFIRRFPDIKRLAQADLDEVNRYWEGLGYYRRCAQMHRAAGEIVRRFGGVFPDNPEDLLSLPGIGRYTAGAVLSIAFDRRLPILEANTIRLHARLLALNAEPSGRESQKRLWAFAEQILPRRRIGGFNQALMDLGSLVCTPRQPNCECCPVFEYCQTARQGLQEKIPYKKPKERKENRIEVALVVRKSGKILMVRSPEGNRWAGLWDFPRAATDAELPSDIPSDPTLKKRLAEITGRNLALGLLLETTRHSVTRFQITLHFFEGIDTGKQLKTERSLKGVAPEIIWATPEKIRDLALNSTARKFFDKHIDKHFM